MKQQEEHSSSRRRDAVNHLDPEWRPRHVVLVARVKEIRDADDSERYTHFYEFLIESANNSATLFKKRTGT